MVKIIMIFLMMLMLMIMGRMMMINEIKIYYHRYEIISSKLLLLYLEVYLLCLGVFNRSGGSKIASLRGNLSSGPASIKYLLRPP